VLRYVASGSDHIREEEIERGLDEVLEDRFETVSQTLRNRLKKINDPDVLKSLHKKALHAGSLEEFKDEMEAALA